MAFCITCRGLEHKYIYILYSTIFLLISDFAFGINYHNVFTGVSIVNLFVQEDEDEDNYLNNFNQHFYIRHIFCYFGTFILSIILYKCEISKNKPRSETIKSQKKSFSDSSLSSEIELIYQGNNNSFYYSKSFVIQLLFLILLWVIEEKFTEKLNSILKHLDFWMFEFIFLSYFCKKYFQIKIYKHQIFAMLLTLLPCALKIMTIILSFYDGMSKEKYTDGFKREDGLLEILYVPYWWLIPVGIFIYFGMKIMRAYIKTKIKWYMDIKYISINKLLMNYGLIGTLFYTIICIISTFIPCSNENDILYNYICETSDTKINDTITNDTQTNETKYFASFSIYFTDILYSHALPEVITLIFGIIGFSFYKYFSLMIIKNLTPIHLVFSLPLFYIMRKFILTISIIFNDHNNENISDIFYIKYILDFIGDFLCLFAYLIYLEAINLNFCNLNFNIRKNIIERGQTELFSREFINESENDDESSIGRGETNKTFISEL